MMTLAFFWSSTWSPSPVADFDEFGLQLTPGETGYEYQWQPRGEIFETAAGEARVRLVTDELTLPSLYTFDLMGLPPGELTLPFADAHVLPDLADGEYRIQIEFIWHDLPGEWRWFSNGHRNTVLVAAQTEPFIVVDGAPGVR